ncbi:MAG: hypothetical protein F6K09_15945 [Merismopedia sp. SIO2A8]|nr:hypothetical protein [Merismopedia sp. SIO2A8]
MLLRFLHKQSQTFNILFLVASVGLSLSYGLGQSALSIAPTDATVSVNEGYVYILRSPSRHSVDLWLTASIFPKAITSLGAYVGAFQNSEEPYTPTCPGCGGGPDNSSDAGTRSHPSFW